MIKNYKEKYNEALEKAREAFYSPETPHVAKAWLLTMFPTIAESEDEKMRKSIIYALQNGGFYSKDKTDEAIAWLEKQRKKQSIWTDRDRTMVFTLLRDVDQMTYISEEGKNERLQWLNSLEDKFSNGE